MNKEVNKGKRKSYTKREMLKGTIGLLIGSIIIVYSVYILGNFLIGITKEDSVEEKQGVISVDTAKNLKIEDKDRDIELKIGKAVMKPNSVKNIKITVDEEHKEGVDYDYNKVKVKEGNEGLGDSYIEKVYTNDWKDITLKTRGYYILVANKEDYGKILKASKKVYRLTIDEHNDIVESQKIRRD